MLLMHMMALSSGNAEHAVFGSLHAVVNAPDGSLLLLTLVHGLLGLHYVLEISDLGQCLLCEILQLHHQLVLPKGLLQFRTLLDQEFVPKTCQGVIDCFDSFLQGPFVLIIVCP